MFRRHRFTLLLVLSLLLAIVPLPAAAAPHPAAPAVRGQTVYVVPKHTVHKGALPAAAQPNGPREAPAHRRVPRPPGLPRRSGVQSLHLSSASGGSGAFAAPTSTFVDPGPVQLTEFAAAGFDNSAPPDTQLAVGPDKIIEMDNTNATVFDKSGTQLTSFGLAAFFGTSAAFPSFSDPKVLFDAESGRFMASGLLFDGCNSAPPPQGTGCTTSNNSEVDLAVSDSNDPAGNWTVYAVASNTSNVLFDQPKVGVNSDKITMSWNNNGDSGPYPLVVVDKAPALAAQTVAVTTFGPFGDHFNMMPVQSLSPTNTEFVVFHQSGDDEVSLLTVTGTPSANNVNVDQDDLEIQDFNVPPQANQPGGLSIDSGDDRLQTAVWKNNVLWTAGTDSCQDSKDTTSRACLHFIQLSTSGGHSVLQDTDLTLVGGDLYYPAVSLDSGNNLWAGFSASSVAATTQNFSIGNMFPTATVAGVPGGLFPPDVLGIFYQSGVGAYNCTFCVGSDGVTRRPRFGDYSGAAVDPTDPTDVWINAEDGSTSTTNTDLWGTAIGRFTLTAPDVTTVNPNSAPELSTACAPIVKVNGTDFVSGGTSVNFGAVAGTNVSVQSPDGLTVQAPAQARGTVNLQVTTSLGTSAATSADTFTYIADTTPPVSSSSASPSPQPGNNGWTRGPVSVSISAGDGTCGSGVKNISYSAAGAQTIPLSTVAGSTASFSISTEGVTTVSFYATDNANNVESTNTLTVKIDNTPPRVAFTTPPGGEPYLLNQPVAASYACVDQAGGVDGGVGVASCVGPVPNGSNIATGTIGTFTFTVNTADKLANATSQATSYRVTYKVCLQYDPTKASAGAAYVFTVQICDFNNVNHSTASIKLTATAVDGDPTKLKALGNLNPGNVFQYGPGSSPGASYIYNLNAKGLSAGPHVLNFTIQGDPVPHTAPFILK